jgi:hypothetical protein
MLYAWDMEELHRKNPRYEVSIRLSLAGKDQGQLRVLDISEDGFQGRGPLNIGKGQALEGVIHVAPLAGERDVRLLCTVMSVQGEGGNAVVGARIDSFGSPDEKAAYLAFLGELAEDFGTL